MPRVDPQRTHVHPSTRGRACLCARLLLRQTRHRHRLVKHARDRSALHATERRRVHASAEVTRGQCIRDGLGSDAPLLVGGPLPYSNSNIVT